MRHFVSSAILLSCLFAFTACSNQASHTVVSGINYDSDLFSNVDRDKYIDTQDILSSLADSAKTVSDAVQKMARAADMQARKDRLPLAKRRELSAFSRYVTIDWTGPLEPLLKRIARTNHYKLRVIGSHPVIPILVSLNVHDTPISTVLRDLRFQTRKQQVHIATYPTKKIIELRYKKS